MTTASIIRDAYQRLPLDWPGRKDGLPYLVVARHPVPATVERLDDDNSLRPIDAVEFTWEPGTLESGLPGWRIVARYQGEEVSVAHGTRGVLKQDAY